ncbi:UDP-N-acetylmuramoyl-L-alanine--D-glutamate ligase [Calycomorphotria hydatis]|uniref:UDP-N-acetylmuramoylalanine--D-glutamate ligase n=1 Tax=Calycomorphotria hydatis TaxID=2528027 RepID=A0A517T7Y6_9PLAN|nr:UDP-N-acetylmuramoyl-L-alanine--D-glutamate ligase [Calycomorphotria hydatis]QDT64486.1 UDP-N-acetylmuramoylalanine--D-glutamate ligase MurD [Calycomorphotria hydatis]
MNHDFSGMRVTVMGLGGFGGGVAVTRYLAERGARVTLTDLRQESELEESLAQLAGVPIHSLCLGRHRMVDFVDTHLVVASPAVSPRNTYLRTAFFAGVPITTEIELFWQANPAKVIGITGTVGKSSTTAMIAEILRTAGRNVWLGGNIGNSLLPDVTRISSDDWVVLELSSFQLTALRRLKASPHISVLTNYSPHHLDWHGSESHYRQAKQTLFEFQTPQDFAVIEQSSQFNDWPIPGQRAERWNSPLSLQVTGEHQQRNAQLAATAARAAGIPDEEIITGLRNFTGLEHRLQTVATIAGRTFIDDAKSTLPSATSAALSSIKQPIRLILGGSDKGSDFTSIMNQLGGKVSGVYLIGTIAERLATQHADSNVHQCGDLQTAVTQAWGESREGEVILLSPGCPSHDQFRDYRGRGVQFRELVEKLAGDHEQRAAA